MDTNSQNDRKFIGLIFDRSYMIYDIQIPMGIISTEVFRYGKNAEYVYGGIPRLCYHLEEYARNMNIPKEQLHKLCIPDSDARLLTDDQMKGWFMQTAQYPISRLVIFRDNDRSGETSILIQWAMTNHIQTLEYDNRGGCRQLTEGSIYEPNTVNRTVFDSRVTGRKYK